MNIRQAKETEYKEVIAFYHDLITKIQPYPCHPTWIIGVYPSDDYLKELILNGQVFIGLEDKNCTNNTVSQTFLQSQCIMKLQVGLVLLCLKKNSLLVKVDTKLVFDLVGFKFKHF